MRKLPRLLVFVVVAVVTHTSPARAGGGKAESAAFEQKLKAKQSSSGDPLTDAVPDGKLGNERMRKANRAAGEILKTRMQQEQKADLELMREAGQADVVVAAGVYDRLQDILAAMEVKHVVVPPELLDELPLLATQTLMINCPGMLSRKAIQNVRQFVERGGHLVTTDWALHNVLAKAFPGTVRFRGRTTTDDVVAIEVTDATDPLLADVLLQKERPRWWLETSSYPITILDAKTVRVLVSSKEMKRKYGESPIVIAFAYGEGQVLHMTSHLFLQRSRLVTASEKQKGGSFAKGAAKLNDAAISSMKAKGVDLDEVATGELTGAYAMQKLSANLLIGKQKANRKLLESYKAKVKQDRALETRDGKAAASGAKVGKDFNVKVLREEAGRALVQDLFGEQGWVPADALER
jgi:hypothetical protein